VIADPGDIGFYFSTQNLAYDYRKRRIERLHKHSPRLTEKLSPRSHDTTIEMVTYRNGMIFNLGWPTSSQLSQRDLRYVGMSDYDSFPDDIGGEGSGFTMAKKRVQVAMSAGMALAESSPKREIITNQWTTDGAHMAPPVNGGILPLYNQGDRRRWHWQCVDGCGGWFEAPALPAFEPLDNITEAGKTAHVICPHCGHKYLPHDKRKLNASAGAIWVPEGMHRDQDGALVGTTNGSRIASFWMLGAAAAFQQWESIVVNYLRAQRECEASGDETGLKATLNTDQGLPYMPKRLASVRGVEYLNNRLERYERYHVPEGVRVLLASVDVQANRFEVLVMGYGVAGERWLIDRFTISKTAQGDAVQPPVVIEHWSELVPRVINATYQLGDGRELRVFYTDVDSGGYQRQQIKADSTRRAYDWWRSLSADKLSHRVRLLKGGSSFNAPLVKESYPDSSARKDRKSTSRGDVPVLILNVDKLKTSVSHDLQREVPGAGFVHLPEWIPSHYLDELTAEQQDAKGHWLKIGNRRNETWDLMVYIEALWRHLKGDKINWERPPPWAAHLEVNVNVVTSAQRKALNETQATAPAAATPANKTFINRPQGKSFFRR
jgi:phage terminase large subunit GpA-like protein